MTINDDLLYSALCDTSKYRTFCFVFVRTLDKSVKNTHISVFSSNLGKNRQKNVMFQEFIHSGHEIQVKKTLEIVALFLKITVLEHLSYFFLKNKSA